MLLPDTSLDEAMHVAEELRAAVERSATETSQAPGSLTISIGVACTSDHGLSSQAVILSADTALYAAKRGGRNRVATAAKLGSPVISHVGPKAANGKA